MMTPRHHFNKASRRPRPESSGQMAPRRAGDASEAGETLVEVLLSLIILALASVALITAFGTDISASAEHRSLSNFDTALASSIATTTSLIQQQYSSVFSSCPTPAGSLAGYPSSTALTAAVNISGFTAAIQGSGKLSAVEYTDGNSFSTNCTSGATGDVGDPQLITVVVTDTATGYSQANSVVVANPTPVQVSGGNSTSAAQLVFATEPEGATVGAPFTTQPILEVKDASGKIVTTDLSPITLTLSGGTNGAALSSTCSGVETSGVVVYTGCSINEVGAAYSLTASEPSPTTPGQELISTSTSFGVYSAQLATPIITSVIPSTVTAGAINVTFTGDPNAPPGQTYTIKACTDQAMSAGCTVPSSITSGSDLTGLTPGTSYYVQITAAPSANYLGSTSPPSGPVMATLQLKAPGTPTLGYGTVAGSLSVTFAGSSNAAAGQTYTVKACTNTAMMTGCVTNTNYSSGANLTGLAFTPGFAGTSYYVQVSASALPGYLASPPTPTVPTTSHAATSQVKAPTTPTAAPSSTQAGAFLISFTEPGGGTAPSSFTATACTDAGMTQGCVVATNFASGAQLGGLSPGTGYYVQITAISSTTGYASANSPVSVPANTTVQLAAPTNVTAGYGSVAGSLSVTFTPPAVVATGQTYSVNACTNVGMTTGCVGSANYTSGADLTGLAYTAGSAGTTYFVDVTANGSSGYLVSPVSMQSSNAATSQVKTPTGLTTASSTSQAGALTASFTPSTGTAPSSYTAKACTNVGMTANCVTVNNYASTSQLGGLTQGSTYFVEITAVGPTGYASATTAPSSATLATVQLSAPTNVILGYGATAGSLTITYSPQGTLAPGQTYTVNACTNMGMTANCVSDGNFTSGATLTGLNYTLGSATPFYVQVTANVSTGYLGSTPSTQVNHADESQIGTPGTPTGTTGTTFGGIAVTFSSSAGVAPASYTATACTNTSMTLNCVTVNNFTSGAQVTGLIRVDTYYVEITANGPAGYVKTTSAVSANPASPR